MLLMAWMTGRSRDSLDRALLAVGGFSWDSGELSEDVREKLLAGILSLCEATSDRGPLPLKLIEGVTQTLVTLNWDAVYALQILLGEFENGDSGALDAAVSAGLVQGVLALLLDLRRPWEYTSKAVEFFIRFLTRCLRKCLEMIVSQENESYTRQALDCGLVTELKAWDWSGDVEDGKAFVAVCRGLRHVACDGARRALLEVCESIKGNERAEEMVRKEELDPGLLLAHAGNWQVPRPRLPFTVELSGRGRKEEKRGRGKRLKINT